MTNSFFMLGALPQVKNTTVVRLNDLIDWHSIERKLIGLYKREISKAGGQEPYRPIGMFKLVLLGQWHGLSDEALEAALRVRLDFMVFTGFELGDDMPDASTICRFRNRMVTAKLDGVLLDEINRQLQVNGLMVKGTHAALLDATIITSAARPRQSIELDDVEVSDGSDETPVVTAQISYTYSADADARWLKKGKKCFFGYRGHAVVDEASGYVRHLHMTAANESEITQLPVIVEQLKDVNEISTDKGFSSQSNRELLKAKGIKDGLSHKAAKGKPLTQEQRQFNREIAQRRFKVEQCFGTLKRRFNVSRARYFTLAKTKMQMTLAAIGLNLLKAQRKLEAMMSLKAAPWQ
jgi:IS5 family transposase